MLLWLSPDLALHSDLDLLWSEDAARLTGVLDAGMEEWNRLPTSHDLFLLLMVNKHNKELHSCTTSAGVKSGYG